MHSEENSVLACDSFVSMSLPRVLPSVLVFIRINTNTSS